MLGCEFCESYWWIFPVIMIFLCFFLMRRCSASRWCGYGEFNNQKDSAIDILNKRYAQGDIDQIEYEEKRKGLET